jgi:diguanylate cyclase (GGDEF)-like protein/PAS domain S-box-containing protein
MNTKPTKILLVEDNPGDARLVQEMLADLGPNKFALEHIDSLGEALSCLNKTKFDVVLLDLCLPDSGALDSLTRIQAAAPRIPIVVLSGHDDDAIALQCVQSGAQDYLVKGKGDSEVLSRSLRYAIERQQVEVETLMRTRQQAAVAELGQYALSGIDLDALMDWAVGIVAGTLGAEYCKVLELLPDGGAFLLRAGEGWKEDLVGRATVDAGMDSQAEFTLISEASVIVEDLREEKRFKGSALFHDHGVISGMSTIIHGQKRPFGVLGVHTRELRKFTRDDINFLRAVANVLTGAIERKHAEEILRDSEEKIRLLLESTGEAIYGLDLDGNCTFANSACLKLLGYDELTELLDKNMHTLTHHTRPDGSSHPPEKCYIYQAYRAGKGTHFEDDLLWRKDGSSFCAECWSYPILRAGEIIGCVVTFIDSTERKQAKAQMAKLSNALEQTADSVMITDNKGIIEYINPAFEDMTGFTRAKAIGNKPSIVKSDKHDLFFYRQLWETILEGGVFSDVFINRRKDSTLYYEEKTITPLKDAQGNITHFISTGKDITERMQTQERLHYLAHHDVLTELPNRVLFMDRLEHTLLQAHRSKRLIAVLFLDMDRFKNINDTLGHDVGDRMLQAFGARLRECVRESDTVARLGGDEFAIILEGIANVDDVPATAKKILKAFEQPFHDNGRELFITGSIGISLHPDDGMDANTLLKNADTAMYRAKDTGRNNYHFYSADMSAKAFERLMLETNLRHALERQEFLLYYQPQVDMNTQKIVGVEALLRWQHPEQGLVSPTEFIPLLEDTGLIVPVGEWVLQTACNQVMSWTKAGLPPINLAVNLSSRQFGTLNLADIINRILEDTGFDPTRLELEITESVIMENAQETINTLNTLDKMGIRFAIDDFGTGYSSLSYLKRFPIHTLKIDYSFVHDITTDPDSAAIAMAIIAMANNLNLMVVAEGVETEGEFAFLRAYGCNYMQGYLHSKPVSADTLKELLEKEQRLKD